MKQIESWIDVRSTSDAIKYAQSQGAEVEHECGKYYRISTQKGTVHLGDNCRAMPKQEREWVRFLFWGLGLVTALSAVAWWIAG